MSCSVHRAGHEHSETVPGHPLHRTLLAARLPSEEPDRWGFCWTLMCIHAVGFDFTDLDGAILASLVSGDVEELDGTDKNTLKIFKNITLVHDVGMVLLEVSGQAEAQAQLCSWCMIVRLCSTHSASALFLWCPFSSCSVSVDSQPSQWHVCWRCHYGSAGSPVKPKSSERLVLSVASAAADM